MEARELGIINSDRSYDNESLVPTENDQQSTSRHHRFNKDYIAQNSIRNQKKHSGTVGDASGSPKKYIFRSKSEIYLKDTDMQDSSDLIMPQPLCFAPQQ